MQRPPRCGERRNVAYKLGLNHSEIPKGVRDLSCFAMTPIPAPPTTVTAPSLVSPLADNDRLGCCTISGAVHLDQVGAAIVDEPWTYPGDEKVRQVYFGLTGGQDTGLQLPQVLDPWHRTGLFGNDTNGGFATVNVRNTTQIKQTIWIFGAAYIAVALPQTAQEQFSPDGSGVWELTHTNADYDIEGGHCVVPNGYSAEGVRAYTWGSEVLMTWEWWHTYVQQCYAVVPRGFIEKGGDGRGFDIAAIERDLGAL